MNVSVFGLGHVGLVTAGCLSRDGFHVIGVDVDKYRIEQVQQGLTPVEEPGLGPLLRMGINAKRLEATTDPQSAIMNSEVSLICVGTPTTLESGQELGAVFETCETIARTLVTKAKPHVVVLRSTIAPGTCEQCKAIFQDICPDVSVYVAFNPEFLREGQAIDDYDKPPFVVIGAQEIRAETILRKLYSHVSAPVVKTSPATAEILKLVCNAWHAAKMCFSNEIGRLCATLGLDATEVMGIVCRDTKLNIAPAYMRPGFAYGGSCLPKDVRALSHMCQALAVDAPLVDALAASNNAHIEFAVAKLLELRDVRIGILGITFKAGTDDLRESPALVLVQRLLDEHCDVTVFDPLVRPSSLSPINRDYLEANHPSVAEHMVDDEEEIVKNSDVLVLTQGSTFFAEVLARAGEQISIVDLAKTLSASHRGN